MALKMRFTLSQVPWGLADQVPMGRHQHIGKRTCHRSGVYMESGPTVTQRSNDISRVTAATTTIAVMMPNAQGIRNDDWHLYLTTVDAVEQATGYDFFANLPDAIENAIEGGANGVNPPGTEGQTVSTAENTSKNIALTGVGSNGPLTYSIINPPAHGNLSGTGENRAFEPNPDFHGSDSFTFQVADGNGTSNISTVNIFVTEVNDSPTAANDDKAATEDTDLVFSSSELTANDNAGPADESVQTLPLQK